MYLKPDRIFIALNTIPGLILVGFGFWAISVSLLPLDFAIAIPTFVVGAVITARQYRMGVLCTKTTAEVRGFFSTRRIDRDSITRVAYAYRGRGAFWNPTPIIEWTDDRGRERNTAIWAFATMSNEQWQEDALTPGSIRNTYRLRQWLKSGRFD